LEEIDAFVRDDSAEAFPKVIDRLLASPRYGERWGRYWLDLARYSDTKGYVYGDREERFFVHAHAYRDWVIRALNEDMPYDRFLLLQIAADQAEPVTQSDLAAMGFLTIGRRFLGVVHDIIDDRIDAVMRTTQGLTVACARCHDHKFDPIPTDDYYSLYGVFANTTERAVPLELNPAKTKEYLAFEKELRSREKKLRDTFAAKRNDWAQRVRKESPQYMLALLDTSKLWTEEFYSFLQPGDLNPPVVRQWQSYLFRRNQAGFDPIFEPWHQLITLRGDDFATESGGIVGRLLADTTRRVNPRVATAFASSMPATIRDVAKLYGALLVEADAAWLELLKKDPKAAALPDADMEAVRQVLYADDSPVLIPDRSVYEAEFFFEEGTRVQLAKLQAQIDQWLITAPGATPFAVILDDIAPEHRKVARVFRRGNAAAPGKEVPRQFLALLSPGDRKPFEHGAGRLDLASAIIDPMNPLTARVMVNRLWQHHFAAGLVATPSDFGTRAEPPTHPELLDHLATRFMSEGWSIKKMHKAIMTSAVYMQAGVPDESNSPSIDPANVLLSRFPRQRLDFESMRDGMLLVTGELDDARGGRAVDLFKQPFSKRRSVYGLVDRQFFPGELRIFDVASPDLHTPTRSTTTVPQQALFFMNSPFIKERAKAIAARLPVAGSRERITLLHQLLYQRPPSAREMSLGLSFIDGAESDGPAAAPPPKTELSTWNYGYGELDEKAGRIKAFTKLPHFTGSAWQGGPNWPDGKLGWVQLTAEGGHAGNDLQHAAVRRWTAPRDMTVSIASTIRHEREPGDGIRAFLVHDRTAKDDGFKPAILQTAALHNQSVEFNIASLTVKGGDTIDFVVDIRGNLNNDDFTWKPVIKETKETKAPQAPGKTVKASWSSHAEFAGIVTAPPPPLTAWEMYAQALLLSNEFMFVD
jgi:hypothetical protein